MDRDMERSLRLSARVLRDRALDSAHELRATLNSSPRRRSEVTSRQSLGSSPRMSSSLYPRHSAHSHKRSHKGHSLPGEPDLGLGSLSARSSRLGDNRALENYNDAVDRLRTLLLSQSRRPSRSPEEVDSHSRGRRSSTIQPSRRSKYEDPASIEEAGPYRHSPRLEASRVHTEPNSQQLLQIINSQSAYIQQLEGENKYCKEELHGLKGRTDAIVAENTRLNEEMKDILIKTALEDSPFRQGDNVDQGPAETRSKPAGLEIPDRLMFAKWSEDLEKLKKLHEIRVRRIEDQLTSTKSDLKRYEKECSELRTKLRMAESVSLLSRRDGVVRDGLCVRCAQEEAVVATPNNPPDTSTLHRITQERDDLVSRLTASQAAKEGAELREAEAYEQVKQSIQLVEQAQLEKTEALVLTEQAKEDILRLQGRMAELVAEQQEKLKLEREATRRENQEDIGRLNHKMTKLSEELAGTTHQLDRVTREKVDVMAELDKAKMQIMQHEVQITKVSEDTKISATTAKVQRDEAMRQLERLRASMESELRDAQQEKSRAKNELLDVRRRLEAAEKEASRSREESIRLVEKLNSIEREANILRVSHESVEKGNRDAIRMLRHRAEQKEQDLKQTIHEMEAKHSLAVSELESMLADQQTLITKLREEGRVLTEQLETTSAKYRTEMRQLKQSNAELAARSERLGQQHGEMEKQCVEHGRLHQRMKTRLQQMEDQNNKNARQIFELLQKQTNLMQERQMLSKEVEFLRTQTGGSGLETNHSNAAWLNSDIDKLAAKKSGKYRADMMIPSKDLER